MDKVLKELEIKRILMDLANEIDYSDISVSVDLKTHRMDSKNYLADIRVVIKIEI